MVQDINRPDVNGVRPTMEVLLSLFGNPSILIPCYKVGTNDNIMSSISIDGSFDPNKDWVNNIYQNSRYFRFSVFPEKRYYVAGDPVTIEMNNFSYKLTEFPGFKKFRKYTGTPEKCAIKLKAWLERTAELVNQ